MTTNNDEYGKILVQVKSLYPFYRYGYAKEVLERMNSKRKYKAGTVYAVKKGNRRNMEILTVLLEVGREYEAEWAKVSK